MSTDNIKETEASVSQEEEKQEPEAQKNCEIDKEQNSADKTSQNEEIEKLKKEINLQKDKFLRTAAEYENFRKRTEKEKAAIYSDATARAIVAILPIADSLERAAQSTEGSNEDYQKGLELVINQFNASLKKLNVESFGEKEEEFNPDLHNAVSHIDSEELGENVISEVFQKGYKIGDKIIRHAMVQVAN